MLRVEVDELHAAGTRMAQLVTAPVALASAEVAPPAADQVSVTVAAAVSARLQTIGAHSAQAAHVTSTAARVLHANASTYREQEELNAAALRPGGASAGAVAASTAAMPAAAMAPTVVPWAPAAPPLGVVPSDGKSIAVLMHGGTGPEPLLGAARAARTHATELRAISTDLRATSDRLGQAWQSPAAETATGRIVTLASWYDDHAQHAATTARACEAHADSFSQARAAVPRLEVFDDLERRLVAANRANAAHGGLYAPVVTALQTQLAATHTQALTAYADYTTRAFDAGGTDPPPPPTVQAVDYRTFKESPYPEPGTEPGQGGTPEPVGTLGLPNYNPESLPRNEARTVYTEGELRIGELGQQWLREGMSPEQVARQMSAQRNSLRSWARDIMADRGKAAELAASDPNMTWDEVVAKYRGQGYSGDALWDKIIASSTRSRPSVNDDLGVRPTNPGALPPIRASAPINLPPGQASESAPGPPVSAPTEHGSAFPDWGTYISPEQIDPGAGDELANLEKVLEQFRPEPPPTA